MGRVEHTRLRRFLPEDVLPSGLLQELVLGWFSRSTTVVWAVVAENDAEAIRREVRAVCHRDACGLLLNLAVEILPLAFVAPNLARTVTP